MTRAPGVIGVDDPEVLALVETLGLLPHPEGGFYRETFRAPLAVQGHPAGPRAAATAIYFLLPAGGFSAWHRIGSDEVWHHYAGATVELHLLDEPEGHRVERLGGEVLAGERPQHVVPAHRYQAARVADARGWALCGCTVAPGFEFMDFELPARATLLARFPRHAAIVEALSHP